MLRLCVHLECAVCDRTMPEKPGSAAVMAAFTGTKMPEALDHVCPGCLADVGRDEMSADYRDRGFRFLSRLGIRFSTGQAGSRETIAEYLARGGRVRRYSVGGREIR